MPHRSALPPGRTSCANKHWGIGYQPCISYLTGPAKVNPCSLYASEAFLGSLLFTGYGRAGALPCPRSMCFGQPQDIHPPPIHTRVTWACTQLQELLKAHPSSITLRPRENCNKTPFESPCTSQMHPTSSAGALHQVLGSKNRLPWIRTHKRTPRLLCMWNSIFSLVFWWNTALPQKVFPSHNVNLHGAHTFLMPQSPHPSLLLSSTSPSKQGPNSLNLVQSKSQTTTCRKPSSHSQSRTLTRGKQTRQSTWCSTARICKGWGQGKAEKPWAVASGKHRGCHLGDNTEWLKLWAKIASLMPRPCRKHVGTFVNHQLA